MKENWTTDMKQKLEGHKMSPPAGLWENIASEMGFQNNSAAKTVAIKRWVLGAAAVVLALIGFFAIYQFNQDELLPKVSHVSKTSVSPIIKEVTPDSQTLTLADVLPHAKTKATPRKSVEENQPNAVEIYQEVREESKQQVKVKDDEPQQVSEEEPQHVSVMTNRHDNTATNNHSVAHYKTKQTSASSSAGKWSIGLNASGGLLASAGQNQTVYLNSHSSHTEYVYKDPNPEGIGFGPSENKPEIIVIDNTSYTLTDVEEKHHIPVSLGLSVHYQLNSSFSLLTGVNYTYLYSEFSIPLYPNIRKDQKLHYLGVPVGLSYQLWKTNGFSLYLSGAVQLEKCLNEKLWQWSVSAAAGAEYNITPLFGIYLEPSLGYYFNDGTSFRHYYKEHPLAPSFEFGLRLHLNNQ